MTVDELIKELSRFPADYEVYTEGCDCYGDSDSLEECKDFQLLGENPRNVVLIRRSENL